VRRPQEGRALPPLTFAMHTVAVRICFAATTLSCNPDANSGLPTLTCTLTMSISNEPREARQTIQQAALGFRDTPFRTQDGSDLGGSRESFRCSATVVHRRFRVTARAWSPGSVNPPSLIPTIFLYYLLANVEWRGKEHVGGYRGEQ
jgi:hypothetical protein